ncbi:MAG TPA: 4Fe-4S dicluster domain-containing protein [Anaerolineales bacterium]|nr:4Fe-4S dicluster domain-containing protein [Anaerolineales bacterium]
MSETTPLAILFDATRCIDCRACMVACSAENEVAMDDTRIWLTGAGVIGRFPQLNRATMPYHCMHCLEPACASACPVGAWTKRDDGPVVYDSARCIGCRYCMNACPFGVPHFEWNKGIVEQPLITKCSLCAHRLDAGQPPACVQTCLTGALRFGPRSEMLAEAKKRIADHPGKYVGRVYGEMENGGTSYLILSHVPFEQLGLPAVPPVPVNQATEAVMRGTIPFAIGWAIALSAVAGGVRLYKREARKPTAPDDAPSADASSTQEKTGHDG